MDGQQIRYLCDVGRMKKNGDLKISHSMKIHCQPIDKTVFFAYIHSETHAKPSLYWLFQYLQTGIVGTINMRHGGELL